MILIWLSATPSLLGYLDTKSSCGWKVRSSILKMDGLCMPATYRKPWGILVSGRLKPRLKRLLCTWNFSGQGMDGFLSSKSFKGYGWEWGGLQSRDADVWGKNGISMVYSDGNQKPFLLASLSQMKSIPVEREETNQSQPDFFRFQRC